MSKNNHTQDKLEQLIGECLLELPVRRAPHGLETRVLTELRRRAFLPWWRKQWAYWPGSARVAFLALCLGLANASVALLRGLNAGAYGYELAEAPVTVFSVITGVGSATMGTQSLLALLVRQIPGSVLYGGLVGMTLLYSLLFGLGVMMYRLLYVRR